MITAHKDMTVYSELVQAIDKGDFTLLAAYLDQVDLSIKDKFGFTPVATFLIKGSGDITHRINTAWRLHDALGVPLNDIVHGIAAAGYPVRAKELCTQYLISPIEYLRGIAYSGNDKALKEALERYSMIDDHADRYLKHSKMEVDSILSQAILIAAAIHGKHFDLYFYLRKKILDVDIEVEVEQTKLTNFIDPSSNRFQRILSTRAFCIISEALGVLGDLKKIKEFFDWIDQNSFSLTSPLGIIQKRNLLIYLQTGLAKGKHCLLSQDTIQLISDLKLGEVGVTDEELFYCVLRGASQVGDIQTVLSTLALATCMDQAIAFSVSECFRYGYREVAAQLEKSCTEHFNLPDMNITKQLCDKQSLSVLPFIKEYAAVGLENKAVLPEWMRHVLKQSVIKPVEHDYASIDNNSTFLHAVPLPLTVTPYIFDRLPRLAPLQTRYGALHFLCFLEDKHQFKTCVKLFKPLLDEKVLEECVSSAKKINRIRMDYKVGFSAAFVLFQSTYFLWKVIEKRLPRELTQQIFSLCFSCKSIQLGNVSVENEVYTAWYQAKKEKHHLLLENNLSS